VFNSWAAREQGLRAAACALSWATTALLAQLTACPAAEVSSTGGGDSNTAAAEALAAFDAAWAEYLALFAAWKRHDAAALEVRSQMTALRVENVQLSKRVCRSEHSDTCVAALNMRRQPSARL
jgi:hypothetical protein